MAGAVGVDERAGDGEGLGVARVHRGPVVATARSAARATSPLEAAGRVNAWPVAPFAGAVTAVPATSAAATSAAAPSPVVLRPSMRMEG